MTVSLGPIDRATRWVNSPPLTAEALRGRLVLVDFWEYTCVNWIRTSRYVKAWHRDYAGLGLVVIGVHAPEFQFGHQPDNIDQGIRDHGLSYPIAIDNDFAIWQGMANNAWPAKYLFDGAGDLVDRWVGEGRYDVIEAELRRRLDATPLPPLSPEVAAYARDGMPSYAGISEETYVGRDRGEPGSFTVAGDWRSDREYVELGLGPGELVLPFTAGEVNVVVQPGSSGASALRVLLDGQPVNGAHGADVGPDSVARVDHAGMVRLIEHAPPGPHVLSLIADDPGLRAYVFTFGP